MTAATGVAHRQPDASSTHSHLQPHTTTTTTTTTITTTTTSTSTSALAGREPLTSASTRRTRHFSYADGAAYSLMVGFGETYLPAFALAIGLGEVAAGLLSSIPLLVGGAAQLLAPRGVRLVGSYRRWVVACASLQALAYIPLAAAAWTGAISVLALFAIAAVYWGMGMAAGPVWNVWIDATVPRSVLDRFLARRSRLTQGATFVAFLLGGAALQAATGGAHQLDAFVALFVLAGLSRVASAACLARQADARVPRASGPEPSLGASLRRFLEPTASRFLLFLLVQQVCVNIGSPYFSPYMLAHLRFSYTDYVLLVSASYLSKIAFYPLIARIVERFSAQRVLLVAAVAVSPMPLFWYYTPSLAAICAVQVVAGFAWGCFELASMLLMFHRIAADERVRILTLYNLMNAAAVVAGSLVGGAVLSRLPKAEGYALVFGASAILRLASVAVLARTGTVRVGFRTLYMRTVGLLPGRGPTVQPILTAESDESDRVEGD
jgi:MFS family permease